MIRTPGIQDVCDWLDTIEELLLQELETSELEKYKEALAEIRDMVETYYHRYWQSLAA
jgi:gentisate 1,2-dioxygenase